MRGQGFQKQELGLLGRRFMEQFWHNVNKNCLRMRAVVWAVLPRNEFPVIRGKCPNVGFMSSTVLEDRLSVL